MNEKRVAYLMNYARLLSDLNNTDTLLHEEINEVIQELRKEFSLGDTK